MSLSINVLTKQRNEFIQRFLLGFIIIISLENIKSHQQNKIVKGNLINDHQEKISPSKLYNLFFLLKWNIDSTVWYSTMWYVIEKGESL